MTAWLRIQSRCAGKMGYIKCVLNRGFFFCYKKRSDWSVHTQTDLLWFTRADLTSRYWDASFDVKAQTTASAAELLFWSKEKIGIVAGASSGWSPSVQNSWSKLQHFVKGLWYGSWLFTTPGPFTCKMHYKAHLFNKSLGAGRGRINTGIWEYNW